MPPAMQTNRGVVLVRAAIDQLRWRSIVVPRIAVLERLCAEVIVRSERPMFEILATDLSEVQRLDLDALLGLQGSSKISTSAWLRSPPGDTSAQNILLHIERLQHIRTLELRPASPNSSIRTASLARFHPLRATRHGAFTTNKNIPNRLTPQLLTRPQPPPPIRFHPLPC